MRFQLKLLRGISSRFYERQHSGVRRIYKNSKFSNINDYFSRHEMFSAGVNPKERWMYNKKQTRFFFFFSNKIEVRTHKIQFSKWTRKEHDRGARRKFPYEDKTPITNYNTDRKKGNFYFDYRFSTCVPE